MLKRIDQIISQTFAKQVLWTLLLLFILSVLLFVVSLILNDKTSPTENAWMIAEQLMAAELKSDGSQKQKLFELLVVLIGWLVFTGLLIAIITNAYFSRIDQIKEGLTRYRFKDHFVIIGYNNMTLSLIQQIHNWSKYENNNIIIHTSQNAREVRTRLHSLIPGELEKKLFVFRGSRDSGEELKSLYLQHARMVLIIGEPDEQGIDSRNIECLKIISGLLTDYNRSGNKKQLDCYLYLENQTTFTLLQQYDLPESVRKNITLQTFNLHESWANRILVGSDQIEEDTVQYYPLDYKPVTNKNGRRIRFVVVGFNRMGQALAIQAARVAHFGTKQKSIITIIDADITEKQNIFFSQYPGIEHISDVQFEFLEVL